MAKIDSSLRDKLTVSKIKTAISMLDILRAEVAELDSTGENLRVQFLQAISTMESMFQYYVETYSLPASKLTDEKLNEWERRLSSDFKISSFYEAFTAHQVKLVNIVTTLDAVLAQASVVRDDDRKPEQVVGEYRPSKKPPHGPEVA